jgi:hypothetical protein
MFFKYNLKNQYNIRNTPQFIRHFIIYGQILADFDLNLVHENTSQTAL